MPKKNAQELVEEMQSEKKFDLGAVLTKTVEYPEDEVTVYLNGADAYKAVKIAEQIAELNAQKEQILESGMESLAGESTTEIEEQAEELLKEMDALLEHANQSALTFTLRGVAPAIYRLLDKEGRRKFPTSSVRDDLDPNAKMEAQNEVVFERNSWINIEMVRASIVKVTDAEGAEADLSHFDHDAVVNLYESLLDTEWAKLKTTMDELTFANALFDNTVIQDADFLRPSSRGEATENTDA